MRNPLMRGRRLDTAQKAKRDLQLTGLADLPTPDSGEAIVNTAYDHLLGELTNRLPQATSFAVTSALPGEGRSTLVANLALAAARRGLKVLVIDADVRHPVQHRLFNGPDAARKPGLLDLLVGTIATPLDATHPTPVGNIRILPTGDAQVTDLAALLSSRTMERFLRSMAPRLADLTLIDAPHMLSDEPGRRLLPMVDGVVFAVRLGDTDLTRARNGLAALARVEARVVGGVFVPGGAFTEEVAVRLPGRSPRGPAERLKARIAPLPALSEEPEPEDLEILNGKTETVEMAVSVSSPHPLVEEDRMETDETEQEPASMSKTARTEPAEETTPPVGVDDLEAVLQGWRRRDYNGDEKKPEDEAAEAVAAAPEPIASQKPVAPADEAPTPSEEKSVSAADKNNNAPATAPTGFAWPLTPSNGADAGATAVEEKPAAEVPEAPPALAPAFTPPPASAPSGVKPALEVALDMFPTAPGEMTLRAATTNAAASGVPNIALELALQMNAMRGMRALTPVSGGGDGARIALEASSTDGAEAVRMRLVVGGGHEPALEATLKPGEPVVIRTGTGPDQPALRLEMNATADGSSLVRATLSNRSSELTLEMRRDPTNDGFSDTRWKNRLALYIRE